jgi:hypothetical protein
LEHSMTTTSHTPPASLLGSPRDRRTKHPLPPKPNISCAIQMPHQVLPEK